MAGVDRADDGEDFLLRHVFEEIGFRPGLNRAVDVLVRVVGGIDDDPGVR